MSALTEEKQVPANAFRAPITCQFAAAENGEAPVTLLARTTEPVMHWYWGAIYHDFDGMLVNDSIAIDYCHDDNQIIGVGNKFDIDSNGLTISGKLVSTQAGDRAEEVSKKANAGIPYEASIDFRGDDLLIEEIRDGFTSTVNGRQIDGPALIFRQWPLRGVAICPHGMDRRTSAQFSQGDGEPIVVRIFSEDAMPKQSITGKPASQNKPAQQQSEKPPTGTAPATQQSESGSEEGGTSDAESGDADPPAQQQSEQPAANSAAQWKAELKKFTDKFGAENGTKWFTDGKTYTEALELHVDAINRQMAASETEKQQLSDKLSALHTGEETPASMSEDGKDAPQGGIENRFSHMGKAGIFASSLKMPK